MNIKIPDEAQYIINILETNGHEAYVVGGCVRDSLLGEQPKDWDICTSALPEQTMKYFAEHHIIETGLQHGTVTLMLNHRPFEITTYRIDGVYTDNRRPDNVKFVSELKEDLARRDFTINAMAYNPRTGIADFFDGVKDLKSGIIKCVGNADSRFQEDALRIMRALRFASALGFSIDGDTSKSMLDNKKLLNNIAAERIANELNKLIVGNGVKSILSEHTPVIAEIIPEILPMIGFEQNNKWHYLDVWRHTLTSLDNAPKDIVLRLAMLFHDMGKPSCYTESDDKTGHFYGHPQVSHDMARKILLRLKYDNDTIRAVTQLILYHDAELQSQKKFIKRWLNKIGEERFRQLLEVKRADNKSQTMSLTQKILEMLDNIEVLLNEIIEQRQCFSLKDLAVNGRDLIDIGVAEGNKIGVILNQLVDMVIDEKIENDKTVLLETAKGL